MVESATTSVLNAVGDEVSLSHVLKLETFDKLHSRAPSLQDRDFAASSKTLLAHPSPDGKNFSIHLYCQYFELFSFTGSYCRQMLKAYTLDPSQQTVLAEALA